MTIRTQEEIDEADKVAEHLKEMNGEIDKAIDILIPHLRTFTLRCNTAACCSIHGFGAATHYLCYAAGKIGALGEILPGEAQGIYAKGFADGMESKDQQPIMNMSTLVKLLDLPDDIEVLSVDELLNKIMQATSPVEDSNAKDT